MKAALGRRRARRRCRRGPAPSPTASRCGAWASTPSPSARRYVDEVVSVSEEEIANAILLLLEIEKTVVEGAGAVALAALRQRASVALAGKTVVLRALRRQHRRQRRRPASSSAAWSRTAASSRLAVLLRDRPGALARLTALVAEMRANVLQIHHDRAFSPARARREPRSSSRWRPRAASRSTPSSGTSPTPATPSRT